MEQIENSLIPDIEELPPFGFSDELPIDSFIKMYSANTRYYSVLLGAVGDPSFAAKLKRRIKGKLITQLGTNGLDSIELDYMLEYILSAMIGVMTYWFQSGCNISRERLVGLI